MRSCLVPTTILLELLFLAFYEPDPSDLILWTSDNFTKVVFFHCWVNDDPSPFLWPEIKGYDWYGNWSKSGFQETDSQRNMKNLELMIQPRLGRCIEVMFSIQNTILIAHATQWCTSSLNAPLFSWCQLLMEAEQGPGLPLPWKRRKDVRDSRPL